MSARRRTKQAEPDNPAPSDDVSSTVSTRVGHSEAVLEWRLDQFLRIGYSHARASYLADTNIDLGKAREMSKQGCKLGLIEDILLGTDFKGDEDERWLDPKSFELEIEEEEEDGA